MPSYSLKSQVLLKTCHPDIQKVFNLVIKVTDVKILCGHRGRAEQDKAFDGGTSKARWGKSKHNKTPSDAVDAVPYPVEWPQDTDTRREYVRKIGRFYFMAGVVLAVAFMLRIPLRWGGHFKSFFDGPHFERILD